MIKISLSSLKILYFKEKPKPLDKVSFLEPKKHQVY
jgi:hypothetical protein